MIICIGIGPGDIDYITQKGASLIREADVIAGFTTVNEFAKQLAKPDAQFYQLTYKNQVEELDKVASEHHNGRKCVVLLMGDAHFSGYQLVERVVKAVEHDVEVVPGISSSQVLASKTKVCFDETSFVTFHRRGDLEPFKKHLTHVIEDDRNAIVIPHTWDFMPSDVAEYLIDNGASNDHPVEVWENLTGDEAMWAGTLADCAKQRDADGKDIFSHFSIMLIRTLNPIPSQV
ncbi:MAG: cobalt-precorrin-7 (C(5))-methyltransferase [Planctomycetota bacterium]